MSTASHFNITVPPLTAAEEDAIAAARIRIDEKPLKKLIKRLHAYFAASTSSDESAVEEAREAFLVELSAYGVLLKKSYLTVEAERRQMREYEAERLSIEEQHIVVQGQIEQLKTALEDARADVARKTQYDETAVKIISLPTRDDLTRDLEKLEGDMVAMQEESNGLMEDIRKHADALSIAVSAMHVANPNGEGGDADQDPNLDAEQGHETAVADKEGGGVAEDAEPQEAGEGTTAAAAAEDGTVSVADALSATLEEEVAPALIAGSEEGEEREEPEDGEEEEVRKDVEMAEREMEEGEMSSELSVT